MEKYLEKRVYVFRRSHNDFQTYVVVLGVTKFLLASSSISAVFFIPMAILGVLSGVADLLEKYTNVQEKKESFIISYRFYKQLLILYQQKLITDAEAAIREKEFLDTVNYLPREKYIREMQLNGYKFKEQNLLPPLQTTHRDARSSA